MADLITKSVSQYEQLWHKKNVISVLLSALKKAELHIHDEISTFGARSDYADTNLLKTLQAAIDLAEKEEK